MLQQLAGRRCPQGGGAAARVVLRARAAAPAGPRPRGPQARRQLLGQRRATATAAQEQKQKAHRPHQAKAIPVPKEPQKGRRRRWPKALFADGDQAVQRGEREG